MALVIVDRSLAISIPGVSTLPQPTRLERRLETARCFSELDDASTPSERDALHERIVLLNLGVARQLARRYHGRGVDSEDIDQTAYAALVRSVQRFAPEFGHDFLEYAVPTIRGEIKRYFRDLGWAVRVPRRIQETQREIDLAEPSVDGFARCSDRMIEDLARRIGRSRDDVASALAARGCFSPTSLDLPLGQDGSSSSLGDQLADEPSRAWPELEARVLLGPLLEQLSPRDQHVVRLRYFHELTQQRIAAELGVSQTQVYRLLTRIHTQLHRQLEGRSVA